VQSCVQLGAGKLITGALSMLSFHSPDYVIHGPGKKQTPSQHYMV